MNLEIWNKRIWFNIKQTNICNLKNNIFIWIIISKSHNMFWIYIYVLDNNISHYKTLLTDRTCKSYKINKTDVRILIGNIW